MANFDAFRRIISSSINLLFLKSASYIIYNWYYIICLVILHTYIPAFICVWRFQSNAVFLILKNRSSLNGSPLNWAYTCRFAGNFFCRRHRQNIYHLPPANRQNRQSGKRMFFKVLNHWNQDY